MCWTVHCTQSPYPLIHWQRGRSNQWIYVIMVAKNCLHFSGLNELWNRWAGSLNSVFQFFNDSNITFVRLFFHFLISTSNMLWLYMNTEPNKAPEKKILDDWMLMTENMTFHARLSYINEAENYHFIFALKIFTFFVIFFSLFNSITEPNSLYIYVLWYVFCYVHWVCLSLCLLVNPIIFQCWKMKKIMIEILLNFVLDFW